MSSKLTVNTNHVLCACVRVRMCVCLVTLLCQCALNGYHVQVPTFFSNWMKDGRDCEKFSVTFVKMLGFFSSSCRTETLAEPRDAVSKAEMTSAAGW